MKKIAPMLVLSLVMALTAIAQEKKADAPKADPKSEATPSVDAILDNYVKAIGGKEANEKITSRMMKGTFEMPAMGMSGTVEAYTQAPNKSSMTTDIGGFGKVQQVFDGKTAWEANPMTGLRELTGGELAAMKREADFYAELNYKKNYSKLEAKGKEKVGDADSYVVIATPSEGKPDKLYFDTKTGLLIRRDTERETAQGEMATETYYDDYKEVDGVKVPHTLKITNPQFSFVVKMTEVKSNVKIEDSKFAKPAN
ncbi:MAG: hypothetical protein JST85_07330 [Acidobacteria bacterium]|nr:hypothetical protein [Acidobacteriota bacterium]